jgi:hypothetical protein
MSQPIGIATTITAENPSLKRLAWAYGCVRKGTSEEKQLEALLLGRAAAAADELASTWSAVCIETLIQNSELRERIAELEHRLSALNRAPAEGVGP